MLRQIIISTLFAGSVCALSAEPNNAELTSAKLAYRNELQAKANDLQNRIHQLQSELQTAQKQLDEAKAAQATAQQNLKTTGERLDAAWANRPK